MILYGWTREEWEVVLAWYKTLRPEIDFPNLTHTDPPLLLGVQKAWLAKGGSMTPRARQVDQWRDMTEMTNAAWKILNLYGILQMTGDPDLPWRRPEPYGDHR